MTSAERLTLAERMASDAPKKLLAIDGGGIRGVLALGILRRMEALLQSESGRPDYRLVDYFDAIAGTSTGGIIAAGLSLGMSVDELLGFYQQNGPAMFRRSAWWRRPFAKFGDKPLADKLQEVFGLRTFGSPDIRSVLMLVLRNASTDSPWPLINNPFAKYNASGRDDCNLDLPLWQLVRASTAAPTFFPPEVVRFPRRRFVFVDGGVTMYNNPAFQLFLSMTVDRYWSTAPAGVRRGWDTGTDRMLLVSVGTGTSPGASDTLTPRDMHLLFNAKSIPSALMFAALNEQDLLCRTFGDCHAGDPLDREVGTMMGAGAPGERKLFRYLRYNAELTAGGLDAIGCGDIAPETVQPLDSVDGIDALLRVGEAVGERRMTREHFALDTFAP